MFIGGFFRDFFRRLIYGIYPLSRNNIIIVIHISDSESLAFGSGIRIFRRCPVELPWETPQNVADWIVFTYNLLYKAQHRTKSLKEWLGSLEYHLSIYTFHKLLLTPGPYFCSFLSISHFFLLLLYSWLSPYNLLWSSSQHKKRSLSSLTDPAGEVLIGQPRGKREREGLAGVKGAIRIWKDFIQEIKVEWLFKRWGWQADQKRSK